TRACLLGALPAALACFCLTSAIATAQKRPATPKDAVTQALLSLAEGNEDKAFAAIKADNDDQKEVIRAIIAFNKTGLAFRDAFIKAYGKGGWDKFQDPKQGPKDGNATLNLLIKEEVQAKIDKLKIEEKGDTATATTPGDPKKTILKKVADGWVMPFE